VGELSEGGMRKKGMYHIPNYQFKGFTLNFVLSNHKNMIPLWVKVVWNNLNPCFHMPHLYFANYCMPTHMYYLRSFIIFENSPHGRSEYHFTISIGLFYIIFIFIAIFPKKF
jgi:hypothetical protein